MSLMFQHLHHALKGWNVSHKTSKDIKRPGLSEIDEEAAFEDKLGNWC